MNNVVSSANIMNLDELLEWMISFIYIMNNKGPNIEPWGTPFVISASKDLALLICTNCFVFVKKLLQKF